MHIDFSLRPELLPALYLQTLIGSWSGFFGHLSLRPLFPVRVIYVSLDRSWRPQHIRPATWPPTSQSPQRQTHPSSCPGRNPGYEEDNAFTVQALETSGRGLLREKAVLWSPVSASIWSPSPSAAVIHQSHTTCLFQLGAIKQKAVTSNMDMDSLWLTFEILLQSKCPC